MVRKVTDGKALPAEVLQQAVSKTDGMPLFVGFDTADLRDARALLEELPRPYA